MFYRQLKPPGPGLAHTALVQDGRYPCSTIARDGALTSEPYQITQDKLLTPEEVEALLLTCKRLAKSDLAHGRKVWLTRYLMVHLACAGGLRASEIAWLRVGDFQGAGPRPLLMVRRAGGRRHRVVHLGPRLAEHIQDYLRVREITWGEQLSPQELLLPGRGGRPYSTAALCFSFRKAAEAARLAWPCSLRKARHFYSAFLLAKTDDLRYVQTQLGHANQSMTILYRDLAPLTNHRLTQELIW